MLSSFVPTDPMNCARQMHRLELRMEVKRLGTWKYFGLACYIVAGFDDF